MIITSTTITPLKAAIIQMESSSGKEVVGVVGVVGVVIGVVVVDMDSITATMKVAEALLP